MKNMDIKRLIDKYLEGKTSAEEELQLAKTLSNSPVKGEKQEDGKSPFTGDLEGLQAIRLMLGELSLGEAEYDDIMAKRKKKPSLIIIAFRAASAIAAILLLVFLYKYNNVQSEVSPVQETGKYADVTPVPDAGDTTTYQTPQPEPTNVEPRNLAQGVEKIHVSNRTNPHVKLGKSTREVGRHHVSNSEEPQETSVEEERTNTETEVETYPAEDVPDMSDPFLMAANQTQDIRSRGERLREEVALLIEQ